MDNNYFKYVVKSMKSGVITVDLDGGILVINDVAMNILDLKGNPVGKHCDDVLSGYPEIAYILMGAFKFKYLPDRAEVEVKRKEKGSKIIGFTLSLISNAEGEVIGSSFFFKDLTKMEQLREQAKLKDRLAALGQMAAGMAHEIRNPLAGIEISAGLLRRKTSEHILIDKIIDEVKALNQMVTECLEFVKPAKLNRKKVDIREILEECISFSESFYGEKRVNLKSFFDDCVPPMVVDAEQMKNVFLNLIKNACEAIEGSGEITVSLRFISCEGVCKHANNYLAEHSGDTVLIDVRDTGKGISREVINKIFNPFFTTKERGTGIGLSIVQKIIDAHKGRMDLESEEGVGSSFLIYLPVLPENLFI